MPKSKVTQASLSGLATNVNANVLPAGSCAVAENVVSRRPGTLTPCPSSTALVTVPVAAHTTGRALWSDADNAVLAATPAASDPNEWIPGTDETQTGWLTAFTVNQEVNAVQKWQTKQVLVGHLNSVDPSLYRDIGFLPGLTHCAFSAFRTLVNEKWGQLVSQGTASDEALRLAGLPPVQMTALPYDFEGDWLLDGNSVSYRAFFSAESTDPDKPFEVIGPVSNVSSVYATVNCGCRVEFPVSKEPIPMGLDPNPNNLLYYVNIYRSSQGAVESWTEIPYDFRLIAKRILSPTDGSMSFTDTMPDAGRAEGAPLYTNPTEQGENGNSTCPPVARDICVFRNVTFFANRSSVPTVTIYPKGAVCFGQALFGANDIENGIGVREITVSITSGSDIVTVSGGDLTGLDENQWIALGDGGGPVYIVEMLPPGQFRISRDAQSTGSFLVAVYDGFELEVKYADGTIEFFHSPYPLRKTGEGIHGYYERPIDFFVTGIQDYYPVPYYGVPIQFTFAYQQLIRVIQFIVRPSNPQNYTGGQGEYTSLTDTRPNRLFHSKANQPEAVPLINLNDIGSGTILKMAATQSALLILCTDGLWRLTGDGTNWQVNQVDPTVTLLHPSCLTTLNNQIYGWVEDGLSLIGEDGAQTISTDAVGPDIREWATQIKNWGAPYFWGPSMAGDRFWNEVWLNVHRAYSTGSGGPDHVTTLVYNTDTKNFTRLQRPLFANVVYSPDANRMVSSVFVSGSPNNIALTVQSDFYDPAGDGWLPVTVWFNALQTEDKGKLKQWMDVNYFVAQVQTEVGAFTSYLKALFDARNESNDPLESDDDVNSQSMVELSRDIHFWVPRRTALSDQQQLGLRSLLHFILNEDGFPVYADGLGFYFELQGFTVRYRNASDTLKR